MPRRTAIALFTRDLRVHDNPTLQGALEAADQVVPLFVIDDAIVGSDALAPNRAGFLVDALHDLDRSLRERGAAGLVVRRGDPTRETAAVAAEVGASSVHVASDWSSHAQRRQRRLSEGLPETDLVLHDGTLAVVPPGALAPAGKDHFAVFTPYFRRWSDHHHRAALDAPPELSSPKVRKGPLPSVADLCSGERARHLPEGGETAGRRRMAGWMQDAVRSYADRSDDLAGDHTSRLSPYLHFGCVSPVEVAAAAGRSRGGHALVRQLAWRDFNLQVLAARPEAAHDDYRSRGDRWRVDDDDLRAWQEGRTGFPVVDAAMRQLLVEGWMHNRARLIVGSFLTKTLYLDWRSGARHFLRHLVDGDVSNNQLNWQWVAGTGTHSRPNRVLNPLLQAERYDPDGDYVRRYVPELAGVAGTAVHMPWKLPQYQRSQLDYPDPIVDLADGRERFLDARKSGS